MSTQPRDDFAIFPAFGGDLGSILHAPRRFGTLLGDFFASRRILGTPRGSPGAPLGRSRRTPGTLQDAPGPPPERPGRPEVDFLRLPQREGAILGAPGASRERFLVDFRIDFGGIFGLFVEGIASDFGPAFATGGRITKTD